MRFSGNFIIIVALFITVLILSNITAVKPIQIPGNPALRVPGQH